MERFEEFKTTILERAKKECACKEQYSRALKSDTFEDLMSVIKDNFLWATENKIIDPILINEYKQEFNGNNIWCNENARNGFLLLTGNTTAEATGNTTVEAYGNTTVEAYDNTTVRAYDNTTVEAYGNATVRATGNTTVRAYDNTTVEAYGNTTVEAYDNATVRATGNTTVRAYDNTTVEAYGNAYIHSYYIIECKLKDNSIYRLISENKIFYPEESAIKIEKQTNP